MVTAVKIAHKLLSAVLILFLSSFYVNESCATVSEADFLSNVAKEYMLAQFQEEKGKRYEVSVGRVDAKKDYGGKCPGFLTARLQDGKIKKNNVVVINCARKDHPFTVNVPVNVTVLREVTVAKDNIPRGSVISEDLIDTVFIPETANTAATITDIRSIVGAKARKDIKAGEQLKKSDFCIVAKGDPVYIEATNGALTIKTTGIAMQEGRLNENIQVKNSKSKKIIEATVTGPGQVRVIF